MPLVRIQDSLPRLCKRYQILPIMFRRQILHTHNPRKKHAARIRISLALPAPMDRFLRNPPESHRVPHEKTSSVSLDRIDQKWIKAPHMANASQSNCSNTRQKFHISQV
ncbi:hypothetical protein Zmor_013284 [Zophobas morio]|uniref:Uncharacterized protein n=1 Tax=Zophobas morio TaxID=2755281 RepID=A0AA38IDT5_9CUCU|nr:hypothetical protein Zmor_013284 [Zophobas morio]